VAVPEVRVLVDVAAEMVATVAIITTPALLLMVLAVAVQQAILVTAVMGIVVAMHPPHAVAVAEVVAQVVAMYVTRHAAPAMEELVDMVEA
jgi:hypothetical protein